MPFNRVPKIYHCSICGKEFTGYKANARYCTECKYKRTLESNRKRYANKREQILEYAKNYDKQKRKESSNGIYNSKGITYIGMLSGLPIELQDECAKYVGRRIGKIAFNELVQYDVIPDGLVIQTNNDKRLFILSKRNLVPYKENISYKIIQNSIVVVEN